MILEVSVEENKANIKTYVSIKSSEQRSNKLNKITYQNIYLLKKILIPKKRYLKAYYCNPLNFYNIFSNSHFKHPLIHSQRNPPEMIVSFI